MRPSQDISSLSLTGSIILILSHPRLLRRALDLVKATASEFFLPQFQSVLAPGLRPLAVVHSPSDSRIPFIPGLVGTYLGYMSVWLKTIQYLHNAFGDRVLADIEGSIRDVCLLYYQAGRIYRRCQSTTDRQGSFAFDPRFLIIRIFDPHLHCIPSLHVMTVCYNYLMLRRVVAAHSRELAPHAEALEQARRLAAAICEAILLVRQHSIADIGPSLFLLSCLFAQFDEEEVRSFVSILFAARLSLPAEVAEEFRRQIYGSYMHLSEKKQRRPESDAGEIILELLAGYLEAESSSRDGRIRPPKGWLKLSSFRRRPGGS